ncbi:uncharacterized protein LOC105253566 isoform X2 [Camponotus floridanus]|uniref:uncharacterized protein LOC105253566 isoform X2 n=1 Tax=Camponotus floridanus TaxID=104421 RepID=UPI000DC6777A|nr:uncharacterized protein LOC105253566 isoform X2 [Camponotus floridanus]
MDGDYYSTVYTWFEKCGIISNIRTHLRQNLVNALKHKDLTLCKTREAKSAKHVPQRSSSDNDRGGCSNKLQSDYIVHTLETLGIDPNRPEGQHIISNYMNTEAPLLLSILSSIASLMINTQSSIKSLLYDKETQANLVLETNFAEVTRMRAAKKKIMQQKQMYDEELRTKESKLKQQVSTMKHQFNSLNAKVVEAQNLMQSLILKEKQLNEEKDSNAQCILRKEMELSMKQNFLTQEANRLQRERDSYKKFEGGLKKLQRELVKMQKEMPQSAMNQCAQNNVRDIHVQTDLEIRAIIDECRILQQEKLELTNLVQEQRSRIEEITLRSVQLSRQLEEARTIGVEIPVPVTQTNATIVSESSSTEDILQDAKMRLKRLEEESLRADKHFSNFINPS